VVLPGHYVQQEVALAYAVTIHKAQGLTVDRSILLVDERTSAEGLYVGMTRGRASNVALAICDQDDAEHRPPGPAPGPADVVVAAMGRSAAEVSALEALREAFARSESLATLAPRLANLNAWIARETPPDRSEKLRWAAEGFEHARRHCRPNSLTRAGRDDRRRLEDAQARYAAVSAEQKRREEWLTEHADTIAYRDQLTESVTERRRELGLRAAIAQPAHVVDLIGPVPADRPEAIRLWTSMAGRIEAYREEWAVPPERLRQRPWDACQEQAWETAVHSPTVLARAATRTVERSLGHDRGLSL
jgi:hypothetical protein